jgi:DEAD/DEAH box helicase domain-containing protein
VDIGALDAVIMLGFPLTVASFRQQAGRAGRRVKESLAILVTQSIPMDQYYLNNPDELFGSFKEDIPLDLNNEIILEAHLQCAGEEMPLSLKDEKYFGPQTIEILRQRLRKDEDGWFRAHTKYLPYPAKHVSIRKYILGMTHGALLLMLP